MLFSDNSEEKGCQIVQNIVQQCKTTAKIKKNMFQMFMKILGQPTTFVTFKKKQAKIRFLKLQCIVLHYSAKHCTIVHCTCTIVQCCYTIAQCFCTYCTIVKNIKITIYNTYTLLHYSAMLFYLLHYSAKTKIFTEFY